MAFDNFDDILDDIQKESKKSLREKEIQFAGGKAQSSKAPQLHLIPTEGLFRLAERFELGIKNKGDKAWNAVSKNQECLTDQAFVLDRITHGIKHLLLLRDKILEGLPLKGDDDSAAVAWAGIFLCSATQALADKEADDLVQVGKGLDKITDCLQCTTMFNRGEGGTCTGCGAKHYYENGRLKAWTSTEPHPNPPTDSSGVSSEPIRTGRKVDYNNPLSLFHCLWGKAANHPADYVKDQWLKLQSFLQS